MENGLKPQIHIHTEKSNSSTERKINKQDRTATAKNDESEMDALVSSSLRQAFETIPDLLMSKTLSVSRFFETFFLH